MEETGGIIPGAAQGCLVKSPPQPPEQCLSNLATFKMCGLLRSAILVGEFWELNSPHVFRSVTGFGNDLVLASKLFH